MSEVGNYYTSLHVLLSMYCSDQGLIVITIIIVIILPLLDSATIIAYYCYILRNIIYVYIYMEVSWNRGYPQIINLIGFFIVNHAFWGISILRNPHIPICHQPWITPSLRRAIAWKGWPMAWWRRGEEVYCNHLLLFCSLKWKEYWILSAHMCAYVSRYRDVQLCVYYNTTTKRTWIQPY